MFKPVFRLAAIMLSILCASLAFTACGGGDDDEPDSPATPDVPVKPDTPDTPEELVNLTSMSINGVTFYTFTYDSNNRVTSCKYFGEEDFSVTYSPLSIKWGGYIVWSDITVNSKGFITNAKTEDPTIDESSPIDRVTIHTMQYDSDGHLTSWQKNDNVTEFTWEGGNLVRVSYSDGTPDGIIDYSDISNVSKKYDADFWFSAIFETPLVITGLLGEAPVNLPSKVRFGEGGGTTLSYELLSNGQIKKEKMKNEYNESMEITHNYK